MPPATIVRTKNMGKLHDLLLTASPRDPYGRKSVPILAAFLGVSQQALYQSIRRGSISPQLAKRIADRAGRRVKFADFIPFFHGF